MRRREKFVISSIILAFGLLVLQYIPLEFRLLGVVIFFFISYLVSAWALFEDLSGVEWLTIVPLPSFYAFSVALFYYLLPESILSRILILVLFGVGMYALYLTANIYSVAKVRTIQLLRAAQTIGLFFSLLMSVLMTNTIFSFHLPFYLNGLFVALAHFPLFLIGYWSIKLSPTVEKNVWFITAASAILVGQFAVAFSFFPLTIWSASLLVTAVTYILLGLFYSHLQERLFKNTVGEFIIFSLFVSAAFFLLVQWK